MPDQPISHLEDRERQPATADHLRRGAGVRSGFDLSLDELSIPPEIAASDTLRQLVAQFGRMTEELEIRNLQLRELLREMNRIVAQFPEAGPLMDEVHQRLIADADKVIRELGTS